MSDFHRGPAHPGRLLLCLAAAVCAAILLPWGAAGLITGAHPETTMAQASVGNPTGTWTIPLTRPDGSPLDCAHAQGSAAEAVAWDCGGVEVASMVAEHPENADRALRRAMRAVTFVGVTPENAKVTTQDLGERGEIAGARMALHRPMGKGAPRPVVALQLRPAEGENKGKVLTVVVHNARDEKKTTEIVGAVWHSLTGAGVEPRGELADAVEVTGA